METYNKELCKNYDMYLTNFSKNQLTHIVNHMLENKKGNVDIAMIFKEKLDNIIYYEPTTPDPPENALSCNSVQLLTNINNSCYMDCVLISLLLVPNKFITTHLLNNLKPTQLSLCVDSRTGKNVSKEEDMRRKGLLLDELRTITTNIRTTTDEVKETRNNLLCTDLRKSLRTCGKNINYSAWWEGGQEDASEFLKYIVEMFIRDVVVEEQTTEASNDLSPSAVFTETSSRKIFKNIIKTIPNTEIENNKKISDYINNISYVDFDESNKYTALGKRWSRKKQTENIIYAPYIIFSAERIGISYTEYGDEIKKFVSLKIKPDENVKIGNIDLELSSIIIHQGGTSGGHYVSYFKCNDMWFFYDDTSSRRMITLIGSYENLINIKHVLTNGTLFFYTNITDKPVSIYSGFNKIKNKLDKWIIFTLKDIDCSACRNAKKLLKKHNIKFTEKLISDKKIKYVQNKLDKYTKKYRYFPMIFKNNKFIGGYDKLEKMFK